MNSIVAITTVRLYLFHQVDMNDWTYHAGRIILFNGPEPALGILAGCLPVMSPCLRLVSNKIKSNLRPSKQSSEREKSSSQHPPTIGQGKRFSLKAMELDSEASQDLGNLEGDEIV